MHVESVTIYPIKSLSGISLTSSTVTARGLEYDRCFMLIDATNRFITQRAHPRLTSFSVELVEDQIRVGHPDSETVEFSVKPNANSSFSAVVWNDQVEVSAVSSEADEFFSTVLKEPIRLVGMPTSSHRQVDLAYGHQGDGVSFADGYPVLIIGAASIEDLNSRMERPVPMNRFRPNIVISGSAPWEEDSWKSVQFGSNRKKEGQPAAGQRTDGLSTGVRLDLVKPCERCIVIRTDQKTGERHEEPMTTLKTYRRFGNKILVGMNCIPALSSLGAEILVGQSVTTD